MAGHDLVLHLLLVDPLNATIRKLPSLYVPPLSSWRVHLPPLSNDTIKVQKKCAFGEIEEKHNADARTFIARSASTTSSFVTESCDPIFFVFLCKMAAEMASAAAKLA